MLFLLVLKNNISANNIKNIGNSYIDMIYKIKIKVEILLYEIKIFHFNRQLTLFCRAKGIKNLTLFAIVEVFDICFLLFCLNNFN